MVAFARKYEIRFLVDRGLDVRMQIVLDFGFSHFYLSIIEPAPLNLSLSLSLPLYFSSFFPFLVSLSHSLSFSPSRFPFAVKWKNATFVE